METKEEIWKPVVGWEGLYEVSNLGNVRSVDRTIERKGYSVQNRNGKNIYQRTQYGYKRVKLCKGGVNKSKMVHRLVAEAFIPNPQSLPFINHKDEVRGNNRVENLEWCTRLYNMRYGNCIKNIRNSHINNPKLSKPVAKCDLDGKILETYPSQAEAARKNGLFQSRISNCCIGKKKCVTHGGFKWKYI